MDVLSYYVNGEYIEGILGCFIEVFNLVIGEVQLKVQLVLKDEIDVIVEKVVVV